jgi:Domain of unknown function (DUF6249)
MKSHLLPSMAKCLAALSVVFVLTCRAAQPAAAEDDTNAAPSPAKHGLGLQFDFGSQSPAPTNYYGLPKEAFDRLSPEQILELAKSNEPPAGVLIGITVSMFAMVVACVALGVSQRLKRARLLHETLRLMIEKGQPIPPELLQWPEGMRRPRNDLRNGLVFISIGIGIGAFLLAEHEGKAWPVAFIPLLIGVALLVARKLEHRANGQPG